MLDSVSCQPSLDDPHIGVFLFHGHVHHWGIQHLHKIFQHRDIDLILGCLKRVEICQIQ